MPTALRRSCVSLTLCFLTMIPACCLAQGDSPAAVVKTAEELWAEIEVFQLLHSIKLSAGEAAQLLDALKPLEEMRAKRDAAENSPAVIYVLWEIRGAVLQGQPITDAMWRKLMEAGPPAIEEATDQAEEPDEADYEEPMWKLAGEIAATAVAGLDALRLLVLGQGDAFEWSRDLVYEAGDIAEEDDAEWDEWLADTIDIILDEQGGLPADADEKLTACFTKIRELTPAQRREQSNALAIELTGLLTASLTREQQQERAAQRLADEIIFNPRFGPCLAEYAQAIVGD